MGSKALARVDNRLREVTTPLTTEQLADYLLISVYTVRRALRELRAMGDARRRWIRGTWRYESRRP